MSTSVAGRNKLHPRSRLGHSIWQPKNPATAGKFDFTPVLDELLGRSCRAWHVGRVSPETSPRIRSSEMLHAESSRMLSQRLDESLVLISHLDLESPCWHVKFGGAAATKATPWRSYQANRKRRPSDSEWCARPLASACACMSAGQQARETRRQSPSL